jgi:hypothetical protein
VLGTAILGAGGVALRPKFEIHRVALRIIDLLQIRFVADFLDTRLQAARIPLGATLAPHLDLTELTLLQENGKTPINPLPINPYLRMFN